MSATTIQLGWMVGNGSESHLHSKVLSLSPIASLKKISWCLLNTYPPLRANLFSKHGPQGKLGGIEADKCDRHSN